MAQRPSPLHLWHLTSLDAPTVAVTWTLAFAWAAQIHLPWWLPTILALSTWSLYIIDRLLDAKLDAKLDANRNSKLTPRTPQPSEPTRMPHPFRSLVANRMGTKIAREATHVSLLEPCTASSSPLIPSPSPLQPRHHFHWKHRHLFLPAATLAAIAALVLVLHYMTLAAQTRNSVLALASLAYLTSVHGRPTIRIPKELLVAIVFTAACTLPILARIGTRIPATSLILIPAILTFTALAWLNCQAIESWESNLATNTISRLIARAAIALASAAALLATVTALNHHARPALLIASASLSALLIALLDKRKHHLSPTTLRTAADLALLTPLALLLTQPLSS